MPVTSTHSCCTLSCASLSHPHSVALSQDAGRAFHVHNSRVFSSDVRNKVVFSRVAIIRPRCRVDTWLVACGPLGYSAALCSTYLAELSTLPR